MAIAEIVTENELSADYIIPNALDERAEAVAMAVEKAAINGKNVKYSIS